MNNKEQEETQKDVITVRKEKKKNGKPVLG